MHVLWTYYTPTLRIIDYNALGLYVVLRITSRKMKLKWFSDDFLPITTAGVFQVIISYIEQRNFWLFLVTVTIFFVSVFSLGIFFFASGICSCRSQLDKLVVVSLSYKDWGSPTNSYSRGPQHKRNVILRQTPDGPRFTDFEFVIFCSEFSHCDRTYSRTHSSWPSS